MCVCVRFRRERREKQIVREKDSETCQERDTDHFVIALAIAFAVVTFVMLQVLTCTLLIVVVTCV